MWLHFAVVWSQQVYQAAGIQKQFNHVSGALCLCLIHWHCSLKFCTLLVKFFGYPTENLLLLHCPKENLECGLDPNVQKWPKYKDIKACVPWWLLGGAFFNMLFLLPSWQSNLAYNCLWEIVSCLGRSVLSLLRTSGHTTILESR